MAVVIAILCGAPAGAQTHGIAPAVAQEPATALGFIDLDMMSVRGDGGLYAANRDGVLTEIGFPLDLGHLDPARGHDSARLGDTGEAVVMLDRYAVRGQGEPSCPDGYEAFLRVFSLVSRREIFVRRLDGCSGGERGAIEDRATWVGADAFRIEGRPPETFRISDDGRSVATIGETE